MAANIIASILQCRCHLCQDDITKEEWFGTTCCGLLYHISCLHLRITVCDCSKRNYRQTSPLDVVTKILTDKCLAYINGNQGRMSSQQLFEVVNDIYTNLQENNYDILKIDNMLKSALGDRYYDIIRGIFPEKNTMGFAEKWHEFTLGIFTDLDWSNIVSSGTACYFIKREQPIYREIPICFIIYTISYSTMRNKMIYFLNYVRNKCQISDNEELGVTAKKSTVSIYVPGLARQIKICLCFNKHLAKALTSISTSNGIAWNGKTLLRSFTTEEKKCPNSDRSLFIKYDESVEQFRIRTKIPVIRPYQFFNLVLPDLKLYININCTPFEKIICGHLKGLAKELIDIEEGDTEKPVCWIKNMYSGVIYPYPDKNLMQPKLLAFIKTHIHKIKTISYGDLFTYIEESIEVVGTQNSDQCSEDTAPED
jgi:hypothetical protein